MAAGQRYKNAHDRIQDALVAHVDSGDYAELGMVLSEFRDEVVIGLYSAEMTAKAAWAQSVVLDRDCSDV